MTMTVGELKIGNIELGLIYHCVTHIYHVKNVLETREDR